MSRDMLADPNWRPSRAHYEHMRNRATAAEDALARETAEHNLTRTALTDSTELLTRVFAYFNEDKYAAVLEAIDAQARANQTALGLTKPGAGGHTADEDTG